MADVCYELKGKNGQIYLLDNRHVVIGRTGWFGRLYQLVTRGRGSFSAGDVRSVVMKEPSLTRGYLRFELGDAKGGSSVVWITNQDMAQRARQVKQWVEEMKGRG